MKEYCLELFSHKLQSNFFFVFFLLNLLSWHWLITLYKLQGYTSIKHYMYIAFCAHHLTPSLVFLRYLLIDPLTHFCLPFPPFPSGNHHTVFCVHEFVCSISSFVDQAISHGLSPIFNKPNFFYEN